MDISNIFLLYDGNGLLESPFSVPLVGFAEAVVTVVTLVKPGLLDGPSVGVGVGVEGIKQLQIKNNNNIIKEEVVQQTRY